MDKKTMMSLVSYKNEDEYVPTSVKLKKSVLKKLKDNNINVSKTIQDLLERVVENL